MKLAPVHAALAGIRDQKVIHTGQHYDKKMSGDFFDILSLPEPDFNLGVGSGTQSVQTANMMLGLEKVFENVRPSAVIVYGDVNSTLAAALVASKLLIPVIHVEAGLRSRDRAMPEEVNRLVTDQLSNVLLTHSREAAVNLVREGVPEEKIFFVGNVMIDTLKRMLPVAEQQVSTAWLPSRYALVTLHRPSNVDDQLKLANLGKHLNSLSRTLPVIFPVHPRTRARLESIGFRPDSENIQLVEPMDYLEFIMCQKKATVVVTDSGGVQEETTYLGTPCLTLRDNTERPVTIEFGTNTLLGEDPQGITAHVQSIMEGRYKKGCVPEYWDGMAGDRIRDVIVGLGL